jgi:hypothetical protein
MSRTQNYPKEPILSEFTINLLPKIPFEGIKLKVPSKSSISSINKILDNFPKRPSAPKVWDKKKDKKWQQFYPHVAEILNSDRAAMVFGELRGRLVSSKKPRIYKFISPCGHKLYKTGDSLAEELGYNERGVIRALEPIRTKYSSKSSYLKAQKELGVHGVFQGMPFLTFYDRGMSLLYFEMNTKIVDEIISGKWVKPSREVTRELTSELTSELTNGSYQNCQNVSSGTVKMSVPDPLEAAPDKALSALSKNTTKNTNTYLSEVYTDTNARAVHSDEKIIELEQPIAANQSTTHNISYATEGGSPPVNPEQNQCDITNQMFDIYSTTMKTRGSAHAMRYCERPCSSETKFNLQKAFEEDFNSDMAKWTAYCKSLTTSKFLMGETQRKGHEKPWELMLSGVCKREMIAKVNEGYYGIGDRITRELPSPVALQEIVETNATVLKFKEKCLELMGEAKYKSWVQPASIEPGANGGICFTSGKVACGRIATNDQMGFMPVLKALGISKMTLMDRDGKFVGEICAVNNRRQAYK